MTESEILVNRAAAAIDPLAFTGNASHVLHKEEQDRAKELARRAVAMAVSECLDRVSQTDRGPAESELRKKIYNAIFKLLPRE